MEGTGVAMVETKQEPAAIVAQAAHTQSREPTEIETLRQKVEELERALGRMSGCKEAYKELAKQGLRELEYWDKTTGASYPNRRVKEVRKAFADVKDEQ